MASADNTNCDRGKRSRDALDTGIPARGLTEAETLRRDQSLAVMRRLLDAQVEYTQRASAAERLKVDRFGLIVDGTVSYPPPHVDVEIRDRINAAIDDFYEFKRTPGYLRRIVEWLDQIDGVRKFMAMEGLLRWRRDQAASDHLGARDFCDAFPSFIDAHAEGFGIDAAYLVKVLCDREVDEIFCKDGPREAAAAATSLVLRKLGRAGSTSTLKEWRMQLRWIARRLSPALVAFPLPAKTPSPTDGLEMRSSGPEEASSPSGK